MKNLISVLLKEWVLFAVVSGVVVTSLYLKRIPSYSIDDFQILFLLFVLFVVVNGLRNSNFFFKIANFIDNGRYVSLKLVILTAILSSVVTNDVALLIMVPLTLTTSIASKADIVILEAMAANAGSSLLPFGNPQNLFIYWFYHINITQFIKEIYLFSIISIFIICGYIFFIRKRDKDKRECMFKSSVKLVKGFWIYIVFLTMIILIIMHLIPVYVGIIPILYTFLFDRKSLYVDYLLLATFFCFFGLTDNLRDILQYSIEKDGEVFLFSAIASQFISNVPAVLLFSDFTHNWKALLWGVNVGGFGNLIGSFANLIVYRIYTKNLPANATIKFLIKFHFIGYILFAIGCVIFFIR